MSRKLIYKSLCHAMCAIHKLAAGMTENWVMLAETDGSALPVYPSGGIAAHSK